MLYVGVDALLSFKARAHPPHLHEVWVGMCSQNQKKTRTNGYDAKNWRWLASSLRLDIFFSQRRRHFEISAVHGKPWETGHRFFSLVLWRTVYIISDSTILSSMQRTRERNPIIYKLKLIDAQAHKHTTSTQNTKKDIRRHHKRENENNGDGYHNIRRNKPTQKPSQAKRNRTAWIGIPPDRSIASPFAVTSCTILRYETFFFVVRL